MTITRYVLDIKALIDNKEVQTLIVLNLKKCIF